MRPVVLLVTLLILSALAPGAVGATTASARPAEPTEPGIAAIYPNPTVLGDAGEFVVLTVPEQTDLGAYSLRDDQTSVVLPDETASGRVTLSTNATATRRVLDRRVLSLSDALVFANGGENITLERRGTVVDTLSYRDAPEGAVLKTTSTGQVWQPLGATDWPIVTTGPGKARAFVLPDGSATSIRTLSKATDRLLVAGYTITSRRVADTLVAAARRNVTVHVLVERTPVGGMIRREAHLLDRLQRAGIEVTVLGGERARYSFHHAKYAIVDDRVLVTTENWKPAGIGGNASRGWGVLTRQRAIVDGLTETFRTDTTALDAQSWTAARDELSFHPARDPPANGSYPARFTPETVSVDRTRLLVAPDNAEPALLGLLRGATESIDVQQVTLGSRHNPLVRATLAAARRGVEVRVLLSSAWYVREENSRLVEWLNSRARQSNLPLTARLAEPRGRFEKVHAKGLVVDTEHAVVGSINWNNNSLRDNREVALVLDGAEVGSYFRSVFDADWSGGVQVVSAGVLVVLAVVGLAAFGRGRAIEFER